MLDINDRVVANTMILSTQLEDELVLMDIQSGNYFSMEAVSLEIWQAIAQPITISALCDGLIARYEAPAERIRSSVLKFLEECRARELIRVA